MTILLILLAVLIIHFVTKFLGKGFKIVTRIMLLIIVLLVILTLLVYKDMNDLRKGFEKNNNTFYLYENNQLYTAVTLKPITNTNLTVDSFNYFEKEELDRVEQELNNKNYKELLKNNYKLIIISPSIINKPYSLNLGVELNQYDLLSIIKSKDPFQVLAEKTQAAHGMSVEDLKRGLGYIYGSEESLKGYLFAGLLANYFQLQKPGELVSNVKEKKLMIYPESISFKVIKYMPWV
ncbi:hypothetical protein AYK26_06745 [Euryarchaeota archaeon SM23-78]|nr:MAG: hypothetical protein AYK26_06745 [Euryarchaeota archaeon SM23-78]MBW3001184.1 hypothetical protein [Candidatus Woesearchaeota archaeon]